MQPFKTAQQWRRRAEQCRALVPELSKHDAQQRMLRLADDYDDMAERIAQRDKEHPDEDDESPAGPHDRPELTNGSKTPGAGALPDRERPHDDGATG